MAPQHAQKRKQGRTRMLLAGLFALAVALFTASAVYAGLTAQATGTETVSSGTLNLTLSAGDQGTGFPSTFAGEMAPGDVNNVYVNLNNTGSLASAAGMTLWVAGAPVNALTDGTAVGEGLAVTMTQCSVAWAGGACSGTTTSILAQTMVSTMNTSGTAVSLSNIPALAAATGQVAHLQVSLTLIGTETSVNGVSPSPTIQGLGPVTLTYTFTEQQRTAVTTNQ
ncbi:MAG TPA: hypothetical protein VEI83_13675 [Acidimicrobiales bacterium]|nr:hypothetical protein [Acidimicrobiales bacterium]